MNDKAEPKKVIEKIAPVIDPQPQDVVTYIGEKKGADVKFGVVFPVFLNADGTIDFAKMKERYNMDVLELVQSGIRQISTRPVYDPAFTVDGCDQNKLQEIADAYKPGSRGTGAPKVTVEKARKKVAEKEGITDEDLAKAIADYKAKLGLK